MNSEELWRIHKELSESLDGERLQSEFNVSDNFPVLVYGESIPLFRQLYLSFLNSPDQHGLKYNWTTEDNEERVKVVLDYLERGQIIDAPKFDFEPGTASTLFHKGEFGNDQLLKDGEAPVHRLSFHPYNSRKMEGVHPRVGLARGIADFLQYTLTNDISARFLKFEGWDGM